MSLSMASRRSVFSRSISGAPSLTDMGPPIETSPVKPAAERGTPSSKTSTILYGSPLPSSMSSMSPGPS